MRRDVLGHRCLRTLRALSWGASRVLRVFEGCPRGSSDTRCPGTAGGVPGPRTHHLNWDLNRVPRRAVSGESGDRLRMLCLGHHFRPGTLWCPRTPPADLGRPTPPPDDSRQPRPGLRVLTPLPILIDASARPSSWGARSSAPPGLGRRPRGGLEPTTMSGGSCTLCARGPP